MLKFLILLLTIYKINCTTNKFPRYVGVGYDLVVGNPLVDQVDPGFRYNVFDLTYDNGETTEDGKFLIPDKMISRNRRACSYEAAVSEYRGTTEYQKDLKTLVEISASTPIFLIQSSFSASTEFQQMQQKTTENERIVMNSGAKCEAYSLEFDRFDPPPVGRGFKNAVQLAASDPSIWNELIVQYGTHYIRSGIFGGRMTVQQSIERIKYQQLEALDVNVKTTAGLSFATISGDANVTVGDQQKALNAYQSRVEEKKELYIGGKPPKSGEWEEWFDEVLITPMPTSYSINSLTDLITIDNFPQFNSSEINRLKEEFIDAFNAYCEQRGCKHPDPDLPLPPPPIGLKQYTSLLNHWAYDESHINFEDPVPKNPFMIVRQVIISPDSTGKFVIGFRFLLSDSITSHYTDVHGVENTQFLKSWPAGELPDGEYITQIDVIWKDTLQGLRFMTNKGTMSPLFGSSIGDFHTFKLQGNLVGARGCFNPNAFLVLGFISVEVEYPK